MTGPATAEGSDLDAPDAPGRWSRQVHSPNSTTTRVAGVWTGDARVPMTTGCSEETAGDLS